MMLLASGAQAQFSVYSYDSSGNPAIRTLSLVTPPQIIGQPVTQIADRGDIVTFSVVVADARGATFQWLFNGTNIAGATGDSLLLTNVSSLNLGQYSVVVSNSAGSVASAPASLSYIKTWHGSVDTDWFNPANWAPAGVPEATDRIVFALGTINLSAPVTITSQLDWTGGFFTGNSLTIAAGGVLNWSAGTFNASALTVSGNGLVNWSGGTCSGALAIASQGLINWTAGTFSGSTLSVATNGVLALSGNNSKILAGALTNAGSITWANLGDLVVRNSSCAFANGVIENLAGALFDIGGDLKFFNDNSCGITTPYFRNAGTLRKSAGNGIATLAIPLYNTGTMTALQGTLSCTGGGSIDGTLEAAANAGINFALGSYTVTNPVGINGPGTVQFTGDTLNLVSNAIPKLILAGGLVALGTNFQGGSITNLSLAGSTLLGSHRVTGTLNWSSGLILGALTVANQGLLNLSGGNPKAIYAPLTNAGTVVWGGTGTFIVRNTTCTGANGFIENLAGALFDIQSDQRMYNDDPCPSFNPYFRNAGLLRKSANSGTTTISIPLLNTGRVSARQGLISSDAGGTVEGFFDAAAGAGITFAAGKYTNANPVVINGPGLVQFTGDLLTLVNDMVPSLILNGGTVSLGANFQGGTITNLSLAGSTLTGSHLLTGTLDWSGGIIQGALTVADRGLLNLTGNNSKSIYAPLTNAGTVVWGGSGTFIVRNTTCTGDTGAIENLAGALFDIQSDQRMYNDDPCPSFSPYFRNAGLLRKSTGTGTTTLASPFANLGSLSVLQGALSCDNGGSVAGSLNAATGAGIYFSIGKFTNANPAVITGSGVVQFLGDALTLLSDSVPNLVLSGGTVTLGTNFQGGAITNLSLAGSSLAGSHVVTGTLDWSGGILLGAMTVSNGGLLRLSGGNPKAIYAPLTNAGTVLWGGTGTFIVRNTTCVGATGAIENLAGALFDIQSDQRMYNDDPCPSFSPYFRNRGELRKSLGAGTTTIAIPFFNSNSIMLIQGLLDINGGAFAQGSGSLSITLNGPSPGQFGQLLCGSATLGGLLNVNLGSNFAPAVGTQFQIVTALSEALTFSSVNLPPGLSVAYANDGVFLTVTSPVPPQLLPPRVSPGVLNFSLPTASGQSYTLQTNSELATGNWGTFSNFVGNGSVRQFGISLTNGLPHLFLRVRVP